MRPGRLNLTAGRLLTAALAAPLATVLAGLLAAGLAACGSGPSRTAKTSCTTGYICQQYAYDLRHTDSSTLPDGFNLGDEIAAMEDECATGGGIPAETCATDGLLASCSYSETDVVFTTSYYDPGLSDVDLCNLKASCESGLGTFTATGLTCGP